MNTQQISFAFDKELMKVGCALLQPAYGGTISNFQLQSFGVEYWQLAPSDNMKLYTVKDEEELDRVIEMVKLAHQ